MMAQKHVLLVDDSKSARFALRILLKKQGFEVDMAESAESALDKLKESKPDAIFMDHMMPGMDGFEATKVIKGDPATAQIPVVMCTSNDEEKYVREAKSLGSLGILPKPATPEKLAEILGSIDQVMEANRPQAAPADAEAALSAAAAAAARSSLSVEETEAMVHRIVRSMFEDKVKPFIVETVKPLVEEQLATAIANLSEEISLKSEAVAQQAASQLLDVATHGLRNEIQSSIRAQTQTEATDISRRTVAEALDDRMQTLSSELREEISGRLGAVKTDLVQDTSVLESLKAVATNCADTRAKDIASQVAQERAQKIAQSVAQMTIKAQMAEATNDIHPVLSSLSRKINLSAVAAAAVGLLGAGLVYFLGA